MSNIQAVNAEGVDELMIIGTALKNAKSIIKEQAGDNSVSSCLISILTWAQTVPAWLLPTNNNDRKTQSHPMNCPTSRSLIHLNMLSP